MTELELNHANIKNLTDLWKLMGARPSSLPGLESFYQSDSWPDRCWAELDVSIKDPVSISDGLKKLPVGTVVPAWKQPDSTPNLLEEALIQNDFVPTFAQKAMYLDLKDYPLMEPTDLDLVLVHSKEAVNTWTAIASASFGYEIAQDSIQRVASIEEVQLLMAKSDGHPVASAMLYQTGVVTGVHLVGVLPDYRGRGIARKIMQDIVSQISNSNARYITLQASAAGEPLYRSLEFTTQFTYQNYGQASGT